jgi:uncharacterized protein YjeT (DUF2065 family)
VWLVLEGLYATASYPERAKVAASAVSMIEDLVA